MFKKIDPGFIRNIVLSVVKPLKVGKVVSTKDSKATLDNLVPDGGKDSNFKHASPFGLVASLPKGVSAFYNALFGNEHEPIILNHLHSKRPTPSAPGEAILYSTDSSGNSIQVKITLKNDGSLLIEAPTSVTVASPAITANCDNATVNASVKASVVTATAEITASTKGTITAPEIELNASSKVKAIAPELECTGLVKCVGVTSSGPVAGAGMSDTTSNTTMADFKTKYNSHTHTEQTPIGPAQTSNPDNQL